MDNVVQFPTRVEEQHEEDDPVTEFMLEYVMPWAESQGIDITSHQFKLTGAGIMALLQGLNV